MTAHDETRAGKVKPRMSFFTSASPGLMVGMRWQFPWAVMVSLEIQLHGWPLAARKTHIPLLACLLDRCCRGPQQSWSPILIGLLQHPPLGQQAEKRLFYIHLANKKLQVDNLCPLWHTQWVVYMTPVSHFFHVNRTPTLCDVALGPTTNFVSQLLWQLGWPLDTVWVSEK